MCLLSGQGTWILEILLLSIHLEDDAPLVQRMQQTQDMATDRKLYQHETLFVALSLSLKYSHNMKIIIFAATYLRHILSRFFYIKHKLREGEEAELEDSPGTT